MSKSASLPRLLLVVLIAITFPLALRAQTSTAGLVTGVVTDSTGAVLPGATITLTETGTNVHTKTVSDSVGHYVFPAVTPSEYAISVSARGCQYTVVSAFLVEVL
jgi:hypothetical protein